jgi:RNA polymerase-interacting CarD/CdnL/TRCF family regulator
MRIKVNDWVVHLQHGIGRVVRLCMMEFGSGSDQRYYEISIPTGTIWVPVEDSESSLRKVTTKAELTKYRALLRARPSPLAVDYRQRQAALLERLRIGSFRARCEVLRDLSAHRLQKPLNETSGEMLRRTQLMVRDEWAMAGGLSPAEATDEIEDLLRLGRQQDASDGLVNA